MFDLRESFHCWEAGKKTGWNMFGVVLWSDEQDQKAVIWCEDHGDLAFYRNTDDSDRLELDAGDWVQFDMTKERHQRFAHNPRLVSEGVYPDLADALCAAPAQLQPANLAETRNGPAPTERGADRESAQIIPFLPHRAARQEIRDPAHAHLA